METAARSDGDLAGLSYYLRRGRIRLLWKILTYLKIRLEMPQCGDLFLGLGSPDVTR
jgi:hypothetical protein